MLLLTFSKSFESYLHPFCLKDLLLLDTPNVLLFWISLWNSSSSKSKGMSTPCHHLPRVFEIGANFSHGLFFICISRKVCNKITKKNVECPKLKHNILQPFGGKFFEHYIGLCLNMLYHLCLSLLLTQHYSLYSHGSLINIEHK